MNLIRKKTVRIALAAVLLVLVAAAACGGWYILRVYQIKNTGIRLVPSRPFEVRDVVCYLQNDPLWADEKIGETSRSLGGAGCLISCAASAVTALGTSITPSELNSRLAEVGGYQGADLIWYKVHEAVPQVTYKYSRVFTAKTIERDLARGLLPVVNVRYYGSGVSHWVLIVGADENDFLVCDPLNKEQCPMPLSTHGNVYSYRVFLKC